MKRIKISLLVFSVLFMSIFLGANALAVVSNTMTVSPIYQRMILVPGESYEGALTISNSNESMRSLEYEIEVAPFSRLKADGAKDDYSSIDHISKTNYNQIVDWVKLEKTKGTVSSNSTDTVNYRIDVPLDAPAGGQYASLLVTDKTDSDQAGDGNINIESEFQFGSTIYAEVAGETHKRGLIEDNFIPGIIFNGPLITSSMVKNEGNVHADAKYSLSVYSIFSGEEIFSNTEEDVSYLVLPDTERYIAQEWNNVPMVGIFKVKQTVDIFGESSIVEKIVIVCPLWLLFIIVFIVVVIVIWLIMKIRSRKK